MTKYYESNLSYINANNDITSDAPVSAQDDRDAKELLEPERIGAVPGLRKAEQAAAEHVRDAEKAAQKSARVASHAEGSARGVRADSTREQRQAKGTAWRASSPAKQVWNQSYFLMGDGVTREM